MFAGDFRFTFSRNVQLDDAEMTLQLASMAVEGLYGAARVRTEFTYEIDFEQRSLVIDGKSDVGKSIALVFTGLLIREIGEAAFHVRPVDSQTDSYVETAAV